MAGSRPEARCGRCGHSSHPACLWSYFVPAEHGEEAFHLGFCDRCHELVAVRDGVLNQVYFGQAASVDRTCIVYWANCVVRAARRGDGSAAMRWLQRTG